MSDMTIFLPVQDAASSAWFDAVKASKLLIQRDPTTGAAQMYPRARIAGAPDREPEWVEASGRGTLYSFTVVHRSVHREFAALTPFVLALVDLEEGPRVTTWILDTPADRLRCGMAVKVAFRAIHSDLTLPCFIEA